MRTRLFLLIVAILLIGGLAWLLKSPLAPSLVWQISNGGTWFLPLVVVAALLDSINPCAFSVLLLTIAFLLSIGRARSQVLRIGAFYIAGIFLVYLLIGFGILQTLHIFNTPHFMAKLGASLLIVLGVINVLGEIFPLFPIRLKIPEKAHHKMGEFIEQASLPAALGLGVLVGLCEFPCTGGPYLMILGLLHDRNTYLMGAGYLVLYNALFIAPLAVLLLLSASKPVLGRVEAWYRSEKKNMRLIGGIAMVVLGALIFFL